MSQKRLTNWQKATALVPLALLSGAWTTSLALSSASADTKHAPQLPDGSTVPDSAIKAPASVSMPGEIAPGVTADSVGNVLAGASTSGIPAAALAAYQRAAQVIDAADTSCNIDWTLIAAIGRVESNHGRYGGNTLGEDGVSHPGIYGIPLDGTNGTAKISDTDAGQFDDDPIYDRAVGPMQVIPSTWSVVGVDGDGDGRRNPQDIDDAALATAVYLCSGDEDLSTAAGRQASVYRYNHSQEYVDLVLSIMRAYAVGDYSSVPTSSAATTTFTPDYGSAVSTHKRGTKSHKAHAAGSGAGSSGSGSGTGSSGSGGTGSAPAPSAPGTPAPADDPVSKATGTATQATKPVVDTISAGTEAVNFCKANLPDLSGLVLVDPSTVVNGCADKIAGMTKQKAADTIPNTLAGVLSWLGL